MIICSFCETGNREGELFCVECGNPLEDSIHIETRRFEEMKSMQAAGAGTKKPLWGTAQFNRDSTVILRIESNNEPLLLDAKEKYVVGRSDSQSGNYPDIDLSPFGGLDQGVSRVHATFQRTDNTLTLIDMNSANGTYLNGQRMVPNQPRVLQDGDEVRFGKLSTRIYFK
jgi:pSer/pThr/pTyr-binding forkhead associated (FHA) protein